MPSTNDEGYRYINVGPPSPGRGDGIANLWLKIYDSRVAI